MQFPKPMRGQDMQQQQILECNAEEGGKKEEKGAKGLSVNRVY